MSANESPKGVITHHHQSRGDHNKAKGWRRRYILIPKKKKISNEKANQQKGARALMLLRHLKENSNVPMLSWF